MEYNQIRYVLSVAHTGNFSRSAEQLFVSQPTLSQQISKLEQELGVGLFDRTTRFVQLTEAGERFVQEAEKVAVSWGELVQCMEDYRDSRVTRITVGLLPTLGRTNLVQSISAFTEAHPHTRIDLITGYSDTLEKKLNNREIDIGILNTLPFTKKESPHMDVYQLEENPISVVLGKQHPLSKKSQLSLDDIQNLPILALHKNASVRICMDKVFEANKIKPNIVCECDIDTLSDLVSANMGISFLTERVARNQRNVCAVPLFPPVLTYTSVVTRKGKNEKNVVNLFRNHLIASFGIQ